jgi:uncharacterized membrane protein YfcA
VDPLIVVFGLGVGVLIGLTGIGGGSLMTPLLVLVIGTQPIVAVGSDIAYGALTKTLGGWRHLRSGTVDHALTMWLAIGGVPAAVAGVIVVSHFSALHGEGVLWALGAALMITAVVTLVRALFASDLRERDTAPLAGTRGRAGGIALGALLGFILGATSVGSGALVSGGTGSGKTTTLNALSAFIRSGERVVTIEDTAELRLRQPHVVRLEARPANVEGRGEVTVRRLVRNALRMRPDRIIVGEVRGGEALDMLSAMSSGHDGSLSTVHAGSPEEALRRVETLALMGGVALPHSAIREQVAEAVDLVVHQARLPDGSRRVVSVAEVVRVAGGAATREVYAFRAGRPRWRVPAAPAIEGAHTASTLLARMAAEAGEAA